jgi:glycosyltransferase involved in cell wall biosynthesis
VVYLPTWERWEVMKQRPQYLLEAMAAAGHEVWFVDQRLSEAESRGDRVHLVPSLVETPPAGVIIYTHFAPTQTLIDRFKDKVVVYDLLDDLSIYEPSERGMPVERTVKHHHDPLMDAADVVIASNPVLAERHRSERSDLLLVENGVDLERFRPDGPLAPELPDGPLVGYHGAVAPWFDFGLMTAVAQQRPEVAFVLVGPVDPGLKSQASKLSELPNVKLMPPQRSERIADFVRGFTVGILPFRVNEMTEAVTPLKMYEYLACGVPMVATPLPACVREPAVRTASDPETFAAAIDAGIELGRRDRLDLRSHAEPADWRRRVAPLRSLLESRSRLTVGDTRL